MKIQDLSLAAKLKLLPQKTSSYFLRSFAMAIIKMPNYKEMEFTMCHELV